MASAEELACRAPPISGHPARGSRPIGGGLNAGPRRRNSHAAPRLFRRNPYADRTPEGAPPTAPAEELARRAPPISARASKRSYPVVSSARLCAPVPHAPYPRRPERSPFHGAQCMGRTPRPALRAAARGRALSQAKFTLPAQLCGFGVARNLRARLASPQPPPGFSAKGAL